MKTSLFRGKLIASAAAALVLTGCNTAPLTYEQQQAMHAIVEQSFRSTSDSLQQQQQQIQQRQMIWQQQMQTQQQTQRQPPQNVHCTHRMVGDTIYTDCQ